MERTTIPRFFALFLLCLLMLAPGGAALRAQGAPLAQHNPLFAEREFRNGFYFYQKRNYTAAVSFFDKAIALHPRDYRSRLWLGQAYYMAGYLPNALTEWQIALNLGEGGNLLRSKLNQLYHLQGVEDRYGYSNPYIYLKTISGHQMDKTFFVRPAGIAVDGENRLYVAGFQSGGVAVFDPNGRLLETISAGMKQPYGIAFTRDGGFFISDFGADRILRFSRDRKLLGGFGEFGYLPGRLAGPQGITLDRAGNLFVADNGNNRVQKFSPDGKFLMAFGRKGSGPGELFRPADVAVDAAGRIYVSDPGNRRIQLFDPSGNHLDEIGRDQLEEPRGLFLLADGRLAIADGRRGAALYNPADNGIERLDGMKGRSRQVLAIHADRNSMLYVSDFDSYHVHVFVPEHLRYVNLDLRVARTLYHAFPKVQHTVIVRDRDGRPITGLDGANFRVLERGVQMEELSIEPTFREKDRAALVFVVDKSPAMAPHTARMEEIARAILESLPGKDRVQVINANGSRAFISQPFIGNVLSPLEGMRRGPVSEGPLIGRALYMAGTELFAYESRQAIVLFTAGEFGDREYAPYGFQTCLHFARNNGIPVYVVKFGAGSEMDRLARLAEETGGALFDALTSNTVYRLRETLFNRPLFEYALYYRTGADERLRGTFREFTVEVRYKELFGHDRSGYYIPE